MSLVLSSDSRASASDDDLPVPPQRGANNTIQRQPPREASPNSQVNSQVGPVRRAHGHTRHGPAPPATGLPRSTANPMRLTSNQARSPAAGSVQNRNPAGTENRAARILSAAMWPPAGIGMEHVDGPINEEFITEVDELFALSGNYSVLGKELAHVPAPRQYVVSVYGLLAVRQAIDRLRQEFLTIPPTITQEVSGALHARNFHYVAVFNDFVKRKIRTLLMSRSLAVYGSEKPRDAPCRVKSMLALVLSPDVG
ncbi:hypothetical protein PCANC_04636 [Puccinia coronata f. sp. avenae]|uniref:Uncharacterized protein n=1 Tax=Puccinia coronata f. sp. avenae TaxID=200324 RepID=A0A2N5W086_9BASI|nr:hypothetical protein PCANC_04636 [Puccinia coronata f. sp. avenae]